MSSPKVNVKKTASSAKKAKIEPKNANDAEDDEEEDEVIGVKGKRKISCIVDSDSDSDYVNDENESDNSQKMDIVPKRKKSSEMSAAKKKIKLDPDTPSDSFQQKLKANIDQSRSLSDVKDNDSTDLVDVPVVYKHQKLDFLFPENVRDANKRRPNHPSYDPTTLYVPTAHLDSLTPV